MVDDEDGERSRFGGGPGAMSRGLASVRGPGRVPWWTPSQQVVTRQRIILPVTVDLARHAGHADIMREQHDRAIGLRRERTGGPDQYDRLPYVARLTELADRFA
jgi:Protein of unknown function (DUF664)